MRTMFRFSTSAKRLVAGAAAVLFLACQGTAVVYARAVDSQQSGAAQGSCHEPGQQDNKTTGNSDCQANCQSQHNSSSQSFANVHAVTDLPAITTRIDHIVAVANLAPPVQSPLLQIEPPPLTILHCCLRN
jgi:hypothetical protein